MSPPLEKRPRPEAEWRAGVANAWALKQRYVEAAVMERAARISDKSVHRGRASQLWLHAENPEIIPPPNVRLAARSDPERIWPATLSNARRRFDGIPAAAAAWRHPPASIRPTAISLKS